MRVLSLHTMVALWVLNISVAVGSEELFRSLDRDGDGVVVADEVGDSHQRLFERLLRTSDRDGDGQLSAAEMQSGLTSDQAEKPMVEKQGSELPGTNALLLLLAKMDANADGEIQADEVPNNLQPIFNRIEDRLGGEPDGLLDRRELTQAAPRLGQIAARFAQATGIDVDLELALLSEKQWRAAQSMTSSRGRGQALADPKRAMELFKQLDANGDGQIALAEVPDQFAERFEYLLDRADQDGDDQISQQELMRVSRFMQARAKAEQGQGPRSKQTAQNIERLLKRLDRDGDRRVSKQEAPRRMAARFDQLDLDGSGHLERKEIAVLVETLSMMRRAESQPMRRSDSQMQPEMMPQD
ncbi:MAG: hypothetical protein AAGD11_17345 [Planctomycetota bacterium]